MALFYIECWLWAVVRLMAINGTSLFEHIPVPAAPSQAGGNLVMAGSVARPIHGQTGNRVFYVERRRRHRGRPSWATPREVVRLRFFDPTRYVDRICASCADVRCPLVHGATCTRRRDER
jgi:hypothetical protein